ncbi:DNA-directed RNA polymerase subunit alpha C-terminal domain-containing protein [Clostridium taeniosporum]|uniref:RNA polymerase sigma-70 region 4 domain-containing protein n=1 Tax=Clostridium taeniosporum TaxID=394958 RepID=A0A1D7XKY8_9CLOT|nr:DNA-directed RNA polymerase subunit alpha C-terminal domain-containing protein [Clostridium taeniosporum]AOR23769.1 hypothetical protein BGI42_08525 [Clostridium taeniosporum]
MIGICDTPFYITYNCDPDDFKDIFIKDISFSKRLYKRLYEASIFSVEELLYSNSEKLSKIKGFGSGCINEIDNYIQSLKVRNSSNDDKIKNKFSITKELKLYKNNIINNDFSFEKTCELSKISIEQLDILKRGYCLFDPQLIELCYNNDSFLDDIINMFQLFVKINDKLHKVLKKIPEFRLKNYVLGYINAFSKNDIERNELLSYCNYDLMTLDDFIRHNICDKNKGNDIFNRFVNWCSFDLIQEISGFFDELFKRDNVRIVIYMRSRGSKLQEIGDKLNVSRERARQIEMKANNKFLIWQNSCNILSKVSADRNGDYVLTLSEIMDYMGDYYTEMLFFLKNNKLSDAIYDNKLEVFILGDDSLPNKVQEYTEELPDNFKVNKFQDYVKKGVEEKGLSAELISKAIEDNYTLTGEIYHRMKLTLTSMYTDIMKRFYTEGLYIYDDDELLKFKNTLIKEYGNIQLPTNNRAISARLSDIGVLCGRGIYRPKKEKYISDELAKQIFEYINGNESPILMTNIIFAEFENKLIYEGIDNKYYLQGILREIYGDKFIFTRDYVSKDETITSMYMEIVNYIKKFKYPVSKQQIYDKFRGVTEIVISISVSDLDILNLFGEYIHVDNLKITMSDIKYLEKIIIEFLSNKEVCHSKEIYEYILNDNLDLLTNNSVFQPFGMYSLLEHFFRDKYSFSRPFVAMKGTIIDRPLEILSEIISSTERIAIPYIKSLAKEYHFYIGSILDFMNSFNDTHLLISDNEIASIDYIEINLEVAIYIENLIYKELSDAKAIFELQCISKFPMLSIPWSEWLIYSILYKWSDKLIVATTSNQFRQSIPIVALKDVDISEMINQISNKGSGIIREIDNLENIDDLISEYIDLE